MRRLKRKMTAAQKKAIAQRKKKEIEAAKVAGEKQPCYYRQGEVQHEPITG